MDEGAALRAGEHVAINILTELFLGEDDAGAGAAEGFVGGGGDDVRVFAGVGVEAGGDEAGEVGHVDEKKGADGIGDFAEAFKIPGAGVGAAARDDEFRLVFERQFGHGVEVEKVVFPADFVTDDVVHFAGEVKFVAVRKVAAVGEIEAHDGIARVEDGGEGGLVGLGAGVGLDVGVFGVEELFGAVAGNVFHFVGVFAAAIIALAGVAFGVFVGEDGAGGFEDGFGGEVFAGDEFDLAVLAGGFLVDEVVDGGIDLGEREGHSGLRHGRSLILSRGGGGDGGRDCVGRASSKNQRARQRENGRL